MLREYATVLEAAVWFHGAGRVSGINARNARFALRPQMQRAYPGETPDSLDAPDLIPAGGHASPAPGTFGGQCVRRGE